MGPADMKRLAEMLSYITCQCCESNIEAARIELYLEAKLHGFIPEPREEISENALAALREELGL